MQDSNEDWLEQATTPVPTSSHAQMTGNATADETPPDQHDQGTPEMLFASMFGAKLYL